MAELAAVAASSSSSPPPPHVVIFPLPAQGHINSMLKLAELLSLHDIRITFLNSERIHRRLLQNSDVQSRFSSTGFQFKEMSDGLTEDPSTDEHFMLMFNNMKESASGVLEDIARCAANEGSPVNCIIADGSMSFVIDVGEEIGVPVIIFRTISASCFSAYFYFPQMIQNGQLPIRGKEDMDRVITCIPGAESLIRCRDLPSFCRASDESSWSVMQYLATQTCQSTRARGIIFNTFEELEHPILDHMRSHLFTTTKLYAVGPLHAHLNSRLLSIKNHSSNTNSLLEEDTSCLTWLDKQPPKSVIYVSFGSIAVLTPQQLTEFMFGLINSKCRFLWVIRPDSVAGEDEKSATPFPEEVKAAVEERGCIVKWAPQEDVLGHPAVGGFLTHSGWNSTLESMTMGVPMVCWPYFADQQVNSRYVSEVWRSGVDMKDECDRNVVERMINDVMVERRAEFSNAASDMAKLANQAVTQGGSSWQDLNRLISDIFSLSLANTSTVS